MANDKKKWFHFYLRYRKEEKEKLNIQVHFKNKNYEVSYKVILFSIWNSPTRNIMYLHLNSIVHNSAKQRIKLSNLHWNTLLLCFVKLNIIFRFWLETTFSSTDLQLLFIPRREKNSLKNHKCKMFCYLPLKHKYGIKY